MPDASIAAGTPASSRRRSWSLISAINGLTTTTRPTSAIAGSW
jgi:hypothetical protein